MFFWGVDGERMYISRICLNKNHDNSMSTPNLRELFSACYAVTRTKESKFRVLWARR